MEVFYRERFLKDLKKLKKTPVYEHLKELAFETIPDANNLIHIPGLKPMTDYPHRYRIRLGDFRVGLEVYGNRVEFIRALHRRDFYRYFP